MRWPTPQPGLVVRFSYLWKREADAGREEGVKDRPCAVAIAIEDGGEGHPRVIVLPITHSSPQPPDEGIELPQQTKTRLGLDAERAWIIVRRAMILPGRVRIFGSCRDTDQRPRPMDFCRRGCFAPSVIGFSRATGVARSVW